MDIHKFVNLNQSGSSFHTSGYAEVAHGNAMGATSAESFQRRRHLERNRTSVRRYGDSMIAGGHMGNVSRGRLAQGSRPNTSGRVAPLTISKRSTGFSNPSGRNYNPFA